MPKIQLPPLATVGISLLLGVVSYLNQQTFGWAEPWSTLMTVGLAASAALAIAPAAHGALATVLRLPYSVSILFASVASTAAVGISTVDMSHVLRAVIVGTLTSVAGMLGGPDLPVKFIPAPILKPVPKPVQKSKPVPKAK